MTYIAKRLLIVFATLTLILLTTSLGFSQAALSIGLSVSPTAEEDVNGRQTYTAVVSNTGTDPAKSVVLTFTLPYFDLPISSTPTSCVYAYNGPLYATCSLGDIPSQGTATAVAVVYPTNVGDIFVNADAKDAANDQAPTAQVGSILTGVGIADVAISLTATPNPAAMGSPLTYALTAYNVGDDDARGVSVSLVLPGNATFVSAPTGCTRLNATVTCTIGHMVVTGSKTFNIVVKPTVSGWTFATGFLRRETVADPSTADNAAASRIWVN
jgi:large repetitive protein